ncbi:MAG: Na+/H+ antiporter NhaA, partial [Actinomycetota bacterium]
MTLFFFVVGLEIKRELSSGHLASIKKAVMPFIAALGGMAVPAFIYLLIAGDIESKCWGVPVATD